MKAIEREIAEIKRMKEAIANTKSQYLKNDYSKNIKYLIKELKEYCKFRGYDFNKILKMINE